jgi:hypothetical protein
MPPTVTIGAGEAGKSVPTIVIKVPPAVVPVGGVI